ncbi:predicted protein [Naegleria gruberi]|uniref:Predicted protein n=1 Tax=Naegleria gruberi TaxID=5762 RepID=D2V8H8_NAEGR|nr:uncharacterized protein NAEGRDRAFT_47524 [Naegleria gruberi]EFC46687.1 predicted protein [Naegleria gruberi]|eukprot:XP_002679431.1 predicted protein [Naegleria gruberi strain NEG-M]
MIKISAALFTLLLFSLQLILLVEERKNKYCECGSEYHANFKHLEYGNVLNLLSRSPELNLLGNFSLSPQYIKWMTEMKQEIFEDFVQSFSNEQCLNFQQEFWYLQSFEIVKGSFLFHTYNQEEESQMYFPASRDGQFMWDLVKVWMGLLFETRVKMGHLPREEIEYLHGLNFDDSVLNSIMNSRIIYNFQHSPNKLNWYITGKRWELNISPSMLKTKTELPKTTSLKIMSYNIHNYEGNWIKRLMKMIKVIERNQPDVICFQEVRLDEKKDLKKLNNFHEFIFEDEYQLIHIKKALSQLGYIHYHSRPAMSYVQPFYMDVPPTMQEEGLAIFSKYPIIEADYTLLYRDLSDSSTHQRICVRARILIPHMNSFITADIFNTHLSLKEHERNQNVLDINRFANLNVESSSSSSGKPTIQVVCGDFNLEPQEAAYSNMLIDGKWTDSYISMRNSLSHTSKLLDEFTLANELTFSTNGDYKKRIDYILFRDFGSSIVNVSNFIIDGKASEYHYENDPYKAPSDHHAVVTEFTITN